MAENDDVPFNRNFPLKPGIVEEVRPGIRRVLCDNPSPFTFTGTVSYIVGQGKVAIIDPGPDSEAHAKALLDAVRGETVTHILVTHTHRDHSPNTPRLKAATGADRDVMVAQLQANASAWHDRSAMLSGMRVTQLLIFAALAPAPRPHTSPVPARRRATMVASRMAATSDVERDPTRVGMPATSC